MKLTWSHRLVFGLILFVTYSLVTYLMNILLVNQQSTSQILFSSLFFSIAMTIGYIKGKSAIKIHREMAGHKRQFTGMHFWAPGYCVSTIGLN